MEIKNIRVNPFAGDKGLKGFADVTLAFGEGDDAIEISLKGLTIRTITKDGTEKTVVFPPSKKVGEKYEDHYRATGKPWWRVTDAILKEFNGGGSKTTDSETTSNKGKAALNKARSPWDTE